ncbi:sensor domain-containing diguanylate cyclase [Rhodobacteraceae bacterium 2376]|uniref:diguanylate cyclase n=1 Tax=Rhabdonatronobacter sediminivivens TaxID=2743469 RepID=A0A7Z0I1E9_9RHOB|nr:sensor domain-containing diguanylate cyclase [Rhabdonatronobacter sediminivivens]NYS26171.1 sensor domain-containing diguanylate cyclase [Rhabdonatronobacter sediminivivens]
MLKLDDEAGRIASLRRYSILDTMNEKEFENIVDLVQFTFGVSMAAISLIDSNRQWFKAKRGLNIAESPREVAFCDHVIRGENVMTIPDAREDQRFASNPYVVSDPGVRCYMGAPLTTRDGYNIGTLCIMGTEPRQFGDDEMATLRKFAKLVLAQIELREKAAYDCLTGALNRGIFANRLDIALERFRRGLGRSSLAVLDLDHFKRINDTYGHAVGDDVLKAIVGAIQGKLRKGDSIARLGGEEFGVLLEGLKPKDAKMVLELLLRQIHRLKFSAAPNLVVTASMGVAHVEEGIMRTADWLELADERLYAAKSNGRNMVVAA